MKTLQDFIDFFEAIPEDKWTTGNWHSINGTKCALGHLGLDNYTSYDSYDEVTKTFRMLMLDIEEAMSQDIDFKDIYNSYKTANMLVSFLISANDASIIKYNHLKHPKQRVIAMLKDFQNMCYIKHNNHDKKETTHG